MATRGGSAEVISAKRADWSTRRVSAGGDGMSRVKGDSPPPLVADSTNRSASCTPRRSPCRTHPSASQRLVLVSVSSSSAFRPRQHSVLVSVQFSSAFRANLLRVDVNPKTLKP
eukprot:895137-Pyramimonas_sp.AAC.1